MGKVVLADITTMIKKDSEENTLQNLYNISTIPAIQIYPYGHKSYDQAYAIDTNTTGQLMGAYLNAEKAQKAAYTKQVHDVFLQFLPKGEVENVNAGNLEEWLSQDSSKARALLVTAKSSTPPMFTKLALDYGAGMLFGELRSKQSASMDKLKELGITVSEFPKLLIGKAGGGAKKMKAYKGKLGPTPISIELAKATPGVIVPELLSNTVFESACTNKGGICVILFASSRFDESLATFKSVAARRVWWEQRHSGRALCVGQRRPARGLHGWVRCGVSPFCARCQPPEEALQHDEGKLQRCRDQGLCHEAPLRQRISLQGR